MTDSARDLASMAHEKITILGLQTSKRDPHARKVSEEIAHAALDSALAAARREGEVAGLEKAAQLAGLRRDFGTADAIRSLAAKPEGGEGK